MTGARRVPALRESQMSLEEDALLLAKVELFANVAPRRLKLLALASSRVLFASGQDLCVEGDEGYEAFILVSGEADVKIKTPSGVATVARLKRNDIVGEMAILRDMPRTATVTAISDVSTLRIGKQDFLNLLKEFPEVTVEVMRSLAERLARTTSELANLRSAARRDGCRYRLPSTSGYGARAEPSQWWAPTRWNSAATPPALRFVRAAA